MSEIPAVSRPELDSDPLRERVAAAFSDEGPLVQALPAFEPRASQREMAAAVADIFEGGGSLLVEAGTGTGKTLAYLVPAILSGQRVLISTGTRNLQDQIYDKDLPALRDALGVSFSATYMKGRGNYLCLHRLGDLAEDDEPRTAVDHAYLAIIREWAAQSETGDRAEVEDLPDDLPLWHEIAATSENCLGTECAQYDECFITRMRQRANESDLVIMNHHLLCADASVRQSTYGEVIPSCQYVVIDEAHQLEDVATQYFGIVVSNYRLEELARDAHRMLGSDPGLSPDAVGDLHRSIDRVRDHARAFFGALMLTGPSPDRARVTADALAATAEPGAALQQALTDFAQAVSAVPDASEDQLTLARRAGEIRDQLTFLRAAADPDFVYFLEIRGKGVFLRAAPIDVSSIIRSTLLERHEGAVLTSATLTVDGSFDYIRGRLGLDHAFDVMLPSEFDFRRQAVLYLPRGMPDPRDQSFADSAARVIGELVTLTEGRAFVLFTSYANLRAVQQRLESRLRFPLLIQGTAPRHVLLREFRTTPGAVLLATASFWQGVDVAGDALSCVVIDKLPFASPRDPITSARMEAIAARGGDPFDEYQVPLAILTLLQGLGRLIRHRQDRGVLALLDPRVRTRGYGRRFLASLPPAPATQELSDVQRFLESGPGRDDTR